MERAQLVVEVELDELELVVTMAVPLVAESHVEEPLVDPSQVDEVKLVVVPLVVESRVVPALDSALACAEEDHY